MTHPDRATRSGVLALLPIGLPLSDDEWQHRHRLVLTVLALHIPVLAALAVFGSHASTGALYEALALIVAPGAIGAVAKDRLIASVSAAFALLGTSASIVELMGGATTAHFHFFVSLAFIALYQSWPVYLLSIVFTAGHHLIMAVWMPMHLFPMGSPEYRAPVAWALVHAVFILGACAGQVTFWRIAEATQIDAAAAEAKAKDSLAEQLAGERAAADERENSARELSDALAAQQQARDALGTQLALLSDATTTVSTGVTSASDAVSSIDAAIREISTNVSDASVVTNEAVGLVEATSGVIVELTAEVEDIGRLVGAIAGIANQTNLLALNATIEAARAGDAGRGFAVVAAEVKALASETAAAAETISTIAGRVQSRTGAALTSMTGVTEVIERINGYTTTIAAAVEEQSATTAQTRATFAEVEGGANDIAEATRTMARQG